MTDKNSGPGFLAPHEFEWDAEKARMNIAKHGIDFEDVIGVFDGPITFENLIEFRRSAGSRWVLWDSN